MFMKRILQRKTRFLEGFIGLNIGEPKPSPFFLPMTPGKIIS